MQTVASIVVLASLYTLLGVGYVLVYRASRVLNLAQGDLMMLGGYVLYATATTVSAAPVVAVPLALLIGALTGVLVYVLLMRPMAGHPIFSAVLVTVSLGILLRVAVVVLYTDQIRYPAIGRMSSTYTRTPVSAPIRSARGTATTGAALTVVAVA